MREARYLIANSKRDRCILERLERRGELREQTALYIEFVTVGVKASEAGKEELPVWSNNSNRLKRHKV